MTRLARASSDAATDLAALREPAPAQAISRSDYVLAPGAFLFYRDTQGPGAPVVLLHPETAGVESWIYQQPVFAAAGYRVITPARRGFNPTEVIDGSRQPADADDLLTVLQALNLKRVNLIGCGAGAAVAADFAADHPDMLHSLVLASDPIAPEDPLVKAAQPVLNPKGLGTLPAEFRELGPSYRAANPGGVVRWIAIMQAARAGQAARQPSMFNGKPPTTFASLPGRVPKLLLTGSADLFMPPALLRQAMSRLTNAEMAVIADAGHTPFWEQPRAFNRVVLDFIGRHSA